MWTSQTVNISPKENLARTKQLFSFVRACRGNTDRKAAPAMKVVGSTCALKSKVGGEDVVRCLSEQSLAISKCKIPLLDEQMSVFLQDMNSCYSKLKELVPTLPTNKKASKVEILQHVIDYIWDLQVELDEPERSRHQAGGAQPRAPLTALNAELAGIAVENGCSDDRIMCR
ncbi:DNA-binding protein inhibitor ID-1 [Hippocampus zosterae]|uniref:DNA-binding protein inhibitor ID-1 n=1 Tax=Hippocampus zosterae TaxID=109293 RepID=UPI00223D10C0|nr:DNA-binding protein inhibitor ID-1 [Hippocampus zosterae]